MRSRMLLVLSLLGATLLLFTACGTAFSVPDVGDRPQTSVGGGLDYEPPASQSAVTAEREETEKRLPAYWKGQSHTLPGTAAPLQPAESTATSSLGDGGQDEPTGSTSETTEKPPYVPPNPQGGGRGDAYEVTATDENGVTKDVQCTPFY